MTHSQEETLTAIRRLQGERNELLGAVCRAHSALTANEPEVAHAVLREIITKIEQRPGGTQDAPQT